MGSLNTVQNGKGDKPRPINNKNLYLSEYDRIFGKKSKKSLAKSKEKEDTNNNESTTNSI